MGQKRYSAFNGLPRKTCLRHHSMAYPMRFSRLSLIGIIGGSGLDNPEILENRREKRVHTPFGEPSDVLITGEVKGVQCVVLARHGRGHTIMPSNVNFRANVWAMKQEGCTHLVVTTACGSLREEYKPGDIVVIDQFIDRTSKRHSTFYDGTTDKAKGVCHIPMHAPFCQETRKILCSSLSTLGISHHTRGTMITIEGPRFSSKAESRMFRSWGGDVINMTTVPEVVLAKEAGLCYAAIALVTDYDCWREHEGAEHVSVELAMSTFRENAIKATGTLLHAISNIAKQDWQRVLQDNQTVLQTSVMSS